MNVILSAILKIVARIFHGTNQQNLARALLFSLPLPVWTWILHPRTGIERNPQTFATPHNQHGRWWQQDLLKPPKSSSWPAMAAPPDNDDDDANYD